MLVCRTAAAASGPRGVDHVGFLQPKKGVAEHCTVCCTVCCTGCCCVLHLCCQLHTLIVSAENVLAATATLCVCDCGLFVWYCRYMCKPGA